MNTKGTYCLCIIVERELGVEVGALHRLVFPPGRYIYIGSAMNGLEARISRHINTSRGVLGAVHWHIDYLLKEKNVRIEAAYTLASEDRTECFVAAAVSNRGHKVRGFGCSDCRCESHLFRVEDFGFLLELGLEPWPIDSFHSSRG